LILRDHTKTDSKITNKQSSYKPEGPEWRNYGPLQIDWSNWQAIDGSHVAPTLHENGSALYLAVNCSFRKLNATGENGAWRDWIGPVDNFEHKLIDDLCKTKQI